MKKTRLPFLRQLPVIRFGLSLGWLLWFAVETAVAQNFPPNFVGEQLATRLDPVSMDIAPDGRIFLTEKNGKIRIVKNGALLAKPFADLPNIDNFNERGLLGIALDPNFDNNHYVYIYYTYKAPQGQTSNNRVSRLTANGDRVVDGSEKVLFELPTLWTAGNHNGGSLAFKDGKLLIGVGDNTDTKSPQSLKSLKGKLLRINTDGSIPTDNPYYNEASDDNRAIWAIGLRNPFVIAVQPGTGRIFVNDVGANSYEEINEIRGGQNFGWPSVEGPAKNENAQSSDYQDPLYAYNHGSGCAITAGDFYNPSSAQFPDDYVGRYFFADYCSGEINLLNPGNKTVTPFASGIDRPVQVKTAPDGTLYFIARGGIGGGSAADNTSSRTGVLWRVSYKASGKPVIAVQPLSQSVSEGDSVNFLVSASGTPLPTYQWQRNSIDIEGANSPSYTIPRTTLRDNNSNYRVVVSNSAGSVISQRATLTVTNNQKPTATIISPDDNLKYSGGDVIRFSGSGRDPEDGDLPASAFTWKVDFYHFDEPAHFHPVMEASSGMKSGSFMIPIAGETSPNVLYRIYLTVKDSRGAISTTSVDVLPIKSKIKLVTLPADLPLNLDGSSVNTPYEFVSVSRIQRLLEAPMTQSIEGDNYRFSSWSNGQSASHALSTPDRNTTLTATYVRQAEEVADLKGGLNYSYYQGYYLKLPDFPTLKPVKTGSVNTVSLKPRDRNDYFAFEFSGYIEVPKDGKYVFYTSSDDGSQLYIGKSLIVDNDGLHEARERSGTIYLQAGKHPIRITYFEKTGGETLKVSYDGPDFEKTAIPASAFFRREQPQLTENKTDAVAATTGAEDRVGAVEGNSVNGLPGLNIDAVLSSGRMMLYNHPNPFTEQTQIRLSEPAGEKATLEFYTLAGQLVHQMALSAEARNVSFVSGQLPSGVYVYSLVVNGRRKASNRLIVVR